VHTFTFGSVPLRTYLPDGDVDVSLFAPAPEARDALRDSWARLLLRALEREAGNLAAPLPISDCQAIQAEVRLVKCVVGGIVVDVSFDTLGGLCTATFLETVDVAIGRDHLFKRSILLIKAWCYYEARLLGAHHGLLSSYALEVMVLHVINRHMGEAAAPASALDVLRQFLRVFAAFPWGTHCLTLLGLVRLDTFPFPRREEESLKEISIRKMNTQLRALADDFGH
jgi:DNA polymerase sigma